MNLEERGLYREVLDELYVNGSIPENPELIKRLTGASDKEFRRSWPKVRAVLIKTESGDLTHPKVQDVLPELLSNSESRRRSSSKAATIRWRKHREKIERNAGLSDAHGSATGNAGGMPDACGTYCESDASECGTSSSSSSSSSHTQSEVRESDEFFETIERIAARHPRKTGLTEGKHRLAQKLSEAVDPIAAVRSANQNHAAQCATEEWKREGGRYAPKLGNYAERNGWMDPPQPETAHEGEGGPRYLTMAEQDEMIRVHQEGKKS
ncbi:MAG: hypothetical protein IT165_16175 [Bryobacterales bacterium]|nr:hypothetical protein [Bryobacterales bacterium]